MRKDSYAGKAKDVMELLEASHLVLEGENILNEAKTWAINSLKEALFHSSIHLHQPTP